MIDRYPVTIERDDGTYVASFPDLPEAHTVGATREEALERAVGALETAFAAIMANRRDIPRPSASRGKPMFALPPLSAAKVGLYRAMRKAGVSKAELARRLDWHPPQIDRLLDLRHASRLDQIDRALRVLGKRLTIDIQSAA
jgi:antitoxin HicB